MWERKGTRPVAFSKETMAPPCCHYCTLHDLLLHLRPGSSSTSMSVSFAEVLLEGSSHVFADLTVPGWLPEGISVASRCLPLLSSPKAIRGVNHGLQEARNLGRNLPNGVSGAFVIFFSASFSLIR